MSENISSIWGPNLWESLARLTMPPIGVVIPDVQHDNRIALLLTEGQSATNYVSGFVSRRSRGRIGRMQRRNAVTSFSIHSPDFLNRINMERYINSSYKLHNNIEETCGICFNEFKKDTKIYVLNCYHYLCEQCFTNTVNTTNATQNCPFCRKEMIPNIFIESKGESGNIPTGEHEKKIFEIIRSDLTIYDDTYDNAHDNTHEINSTIENNKMDELD